MSTFEQKTIAVIGLGYVGLPLAVEFGKKYKTIGFDISYNRVEELKSGLDRTKEVETNSLIEATKLSLTSDEKEIKGKDFYIVTVPTPVDKFNTPDLKPLLSGAITVGRAMKKGAIVVFESTVYPGCTEEECVPVLERESGFTFNIDFFCGYSPERINPGDKNHTLTTIKKITSGSTAEAALKIDELYRSIIVAGTHVAQSIKVAEAAKVIENAQRDINIAFVNELSKIFQKIGIDTYDVLEAAGTKWNFLGFKPGLVGGHCIGVDPFYLTHKAQELGYYPEIILSGRRLNDSMGAYIAEQIVKLMIRKNNIVNKSRVLVLGITFKENCPDIRNSKVIDVIKGLQDFGCHIDVYDPWADPKEVYEEYKIKLIKTIDKESYYAVVAAVAHDEFTLFDPRKYIINNGIVYDIKGIFPQNTVDGRL